jgi:hypothetical protein
MRLLFAPLISHSHKEIQVARIAHHGTCVPGKAGERYSSHTLDSFLNLTGHNECEHRQ